MPPTDPSNTDPNVVDPNVVTSDNAALDPALAAYLAEIAAKAALDKAVSDAAEVAKAAHNDIAAANDDVATKTSAEAATRTKLGTEVNAAGSGVSIARDDGTTLSLLADGSTTYHPIVTRTLVMPAAPQPPKDTMSSLPAEAVTDSPTAEPPTLSDAHAPETASASGSSF